MGGDDEIERENLFVSNSRESMVSSVDPKFEE